MWAGIAGTPINNNSQFEIAISVHDSVYSTDFASETIAYTKGDAEKNAKNIQQHVLEVLRKFSTEHLCKFLGAGVTLTLLKEVRIVCDLLCSTILHHSSRHRTCVPISGWTWTLFLLSSTSRPSTRTLPLGRTSSTVSLLPQALTSLQGLRRLLCT